jgi:hypothetical protein
LGDEPKGIFSFRPTRSLAFPICDLLSVVTCYP